MLLVLPLPAPPGTRGQEPPDEADRGTQTEAAGEEMDVVLEAAPEPGIPEEYVQGRGYLGHYPETWATSLLYEPANARVFLALQDGATRPSLASLDVPDLDVVLKDLAAGRIVRESQGVLRPAFPVIRGEMRAAFGRIVQTAADRVYAELRPSLKKVLKAARKEKVLPWLYTLAWSEILGSRGAEKALSDAGVLDPLRLRNEGYLWIMIPNEPFLTADEWYSSGSETLHALWGPSTYILATVQDIDVRRRILDRALDGRPWDDPSEEEDLTELGILDAQKRVRIPALRKNSRLLTAMRASSRRYVKSVLAALEPDSLAALLKVRRDEAFAIAYACIGYKILERAHAEGLITRPEFLSTSESPLAGVSSTLALTADEVFDPLERAYYLYDGEHFAEAVRHCEIFLETHPGDPEAIFRKGISLMKLRKYEEALRTFGEVLSKPAEPGDVWRGWILIRAGNALDVLHRREEALKRYQEALQYSLVWGSHQTARNWIDSVYRD